MLGVLVYHILFPISFVAAQHHRSHGCHILLSHTPCTVLHVLPTPTILAQFDSNKAPSTNEIPNGSPSSTSNVHPPRCRLQTTTAHISRIDSYRTYPSHPRLCSPILQPHHHLNLRPECELSSRPLLPRLPTRSPRRTACCTNRHFPIRLRHG